MKNNLNEIKIELEKLKHYNYKDRNILERLLREISDNRKDEIAEVKRLLQFLIALSIANLSLANPLIAELIAKFSWSTYGPPSGGPFFL